MTRMPRMRGAITGNFGKAKVKAGSPLISIGESDAEVVRITPVSEYNQRLIQAYHNTQDYKLRRFIVEQLTNFHRQRGTFESRLS